MNDLGRGVKLVTRSEWDARRPRDTTPVTPSFGVTVHWEGPKMGEFPHSACAGKVREIQRYHMDTKGWDDIAYTGVPCPHGYVFEGRWVGRRTAANGTDAGNDTAYALCWLGGQGDPFTEAGKIAIRAAADWLDAHGGAGSGRNCHRDWKATECPGDVICSWVRAGLPAGTLEPEEDDMPDEATFKRWVREVLNEGTGAGQKSWAGTSKAQLDASQDARREVGELQTTVARVETKLDQSLASEAG
jgi:hypothetical protein